MNSKTLLAFITAITFAYGVISSPLYANEEIENTCMDKADQQNLKGDEWDNFVTKCIEETQPKDPN